MRFVLARGKRPSEELRLSIDFATDVAKVTGDSPASIDVKAADQAGADVTNAQVKDVQRVGTVVYCSFYGGAKNTYEVNFKLVTTQGFKYEHGIAVPTDPLA